MASCFVNNVKHYRGSLKRILLQHDHPLLTSISFGQELPTGSILPICLNSHPGSRNFVQEKSFSFAFCFKPLLLRKLILLSSTKFSAIEK